ncbi:hypothetical protein FKM82_017773, partial [Ascaphus truei]
DENCSLKKNVNILEEKLQNIKQEYKNKTGLLMSEIKTKEEEFKTQIQKIQCEMEAKFKLKEEENNNLLAEKDMEISELTRQQRKQEKEKQSEMIKQQIEFNAKLARIQNKAAKSYPDTNTLSQNIYRM